MPIASSFSFLYIVFSENPSYVVEDLLQRDCLPPAATSLYAQVPALLAPLIWLAIPFYMGAWQKRGCVPRANCDTIYGLRERYTRALHQCCTWRAHPHRRFDNRSSIFARPNRPMRVSRPWFYPPDEPVSVFPARLC